MYRRGKTKRSCCTRADATCGTIHTCTGYAQMACLEDVYQKLKGSKSEKCHSAPYGGHYGIFRTQAKIWQSGFYWPSMYEDARNFIMRCRNCQLQGGITSRDAMPLHSNFQVELFDVWGIDFMGPFPKSKDCEYILVAIDYVSKWVEALPCRAANAKHARKMFHEIIFPRFGTPRMVISDGGSHFINRTF